MVTIVVPSNDHTVLLEHPIEKLTYIRLLSCSLCNNWYNLKNPRTFALIETGDGKEIKSGKLTFRSVETLTKNFTTLHPTTCIAWR